MDGPPALTLGLEPIRDDILIIRLQEEMKILFQVHDQPYFCKRYFYLLLYLCSSILLTF